MEFLTTWFLGLVVVLALSAYYYSKNRKSNNLPTNDITGEISLPVAEEVKPTVVEEVATATVVESTKPVAKKAPVAKKPAAKKAPAKKPVAKKPAAKTKKPAAKPAK